jgi:lipopolysaccharide/colanic/teichoic acid biosynthesis glycosyltransferase
MPGGSRFNELARIWSEAGHEVTVVAGTLDHSTGVVPPQYHGRWLTKENDGPVMVWRCHVPSSYARSYLGRMRAFLGFTLSALTVVLRVTRPDVIVASSPPLVIALPAWVGARIRFRRVPWVFEIRDLWPESAVTTGVLAEGNLLTRLLYRLERWACASADRVNVLTPAFREDLLRRHLVPERRLVFVPNGADMDVFVPGPRDNDLRREAGWGDRFVVLYSGAHGRANAIGQLVEAAECLRNSPEILIACVGDGPERRHWQQEAARRGLENIRFLGPQPKERMPAYVNACDVGTAVLQRNQTFKTVYPNKVFDYMACAKPVLLAVDGAARQLVCAEARAGVFVEPEDPAAIAAAVRSLAADASGREQMGRRGYEWVRANANRTALADRYLGILERIVAEGTRGRAGVLTKGVLDRLVAFLGLLLLSPLLGFIGMAILLSTGTPVLFRQQRPGLFGRPFFLLKFRTMATGSGPDDSRLTNVGRFLRRTSLDELPELWNVLRGEMSLVGPRPLLMQYLDRYTPRQGRRHEVKPGITGWAQVNGRNALSWDTKFELDVWYVAHWSLWLDLKILALTARQVLTRQGINHPGSATMPEFTGTFDATSKE